MQHNSLLTRGWPWGSFLEVRTNAAAVYNRTAARERRWAENRGHSFSIFMSSATDPLVPQERRFRITEGVLRAMIADPPDRLILQTHSHRAVDYEALYATLAGNAEVRIHISIESDIERLPGLPAPASSVQARFDAARQLKRAGLNVVITVAPLLPIRDPDAFFARVGEAAGAVVIDHFIEGDGTSSGSRTRKTRLVEAMRAVDPASVEFSYRDAMVAAARRHLPGRVGVGASGFAGRFE